MLDPQPPFYPAPPVFTLRHPGPVSRCGPRVSEQRRAAPIHQLPGTIPSTAAAGVNAGLATTKVKICEECYLLLVKSWELMCVV